MTDPTTTATGDFPAADAIERLTELGAALTASEELTVGDAPDLLIRTIPVGYRTDILDVSEHDHLRHAPRRVRGQAVVTNTASWLAYFGKHGDDNAEIYGDVQRSTITALLNAPGGPAEPGWGDHRVVLKLEHSPAWQTWTALNDSWLTQDKFAELIEARTPDLVSPDAATMLEVAQSISATTSTRFEAGSRLHDGQRRFQFMETIESKAGQRGDLAVPTEIAIKLIVWRGVAIEVPLTARFRFRIEGGNLRIAYVLDRLEDVLDAAWGALLSELTDTLPVPVLAGVAPDYAAG